LATTAGQFNYENADSALKDTYPRLNTGGAEATFVSDGTNWQVMDEALGQVPSCWVYLNTNQTDFTDGTGLFVDLNAEEYDIGNNFDISTWVSGSTTSTSANHLIDSNGSFTSDMVDHRVKNTTDSTYTYVTAYNSATDLTVRDDIFTSGEEYEIKNAKFVVPISGQYSFVASFLLDASVVLDKRYVFGIYNGTTGIIRYHSQVPTQDYFSCIFTGTDYFSANDEIRTLFESHSGNNTVDLFGSTKTTTFLQIRLISKD